MPVLECTLRNLANLRTILAFGSQAYRSIQRLLHIEKSWRSAIEHDGPIHAQFEGRDLSVVALNHPAARISPALTRARLERILGD
jgi:hypothetical protein